MKLPSFRYFLNPLKLGVIEIEKTFCPVCKSEKDYQYALTPYGEHDLEGICPWCISNGDAAKIFDASFNDVYNNGLMPRKGSIKKEAIEEVSLRTPTYASWQSEVWLDCCNDFCAFVDYVGWREIEHLYDELKEDIAYICDYMGLTLEEFKEGLINEGWHQGYLFQCLHCKKHRLYTDIG